MPKNSNYHAYYLLGEDQFTDSPRPATGITELGCLAHARRKFFDLNSAKANPIALEALNRIAALYGIEHDGKHLDATARTQWRQEKAQPLLDSMHDWLRQPRIMVADGTGLAKAIDHSLKRWDALSRYASDGRFPIDNNPVENIIRPIVLGRRNWLFTGSERAGQRAAAIQSCSVPQNSMAWIRPCGCVRRWKNYQRA
jgi:transposase